eukprot:3141880-Amphidinium_carterae.1
MIYNFVTSKFGFLESNGNSLCWDSHRTFRRARRALERHGTAAICGGLAHLGLANSFTPLQPHFNPLGVITILMRSQSAKLHAILQV